MGGVCGQELLVVEGKSAAYRPGAEHRGDAGLPVDEGAVAVEAQYLVVGESHRPRSLMRSRKNRSAAPRCACHASRAGRILPARRAWSTAPCSAASSFAPRQTGRSWAISIRSSAPRLLKVRSSRGDPDAASTERWNAMA